MTLRLTGSVEMKRCPICKGAGSVVLDDTYGVRSGQWVKNGRVPCPECKGKKTVEAKGHDPKV